MIPFGSRFIGMLALLTLLTACGQPAGIQPMPPVAAGQARSTTAATEPPHGAPAYAQRATRQAVTGTAPAPHTCHYRSAADGALLPDPACTPGATDPRVNQADIAATICVRGYTSRVRPVVEETDHAKYLLMRAYATHAHNELDHLIPLEIGGSSSLRNLWPEPGPIPNTKDGIENELHDLVCAGVWHPGTAYLPLAAAQHLIASDWTTAVTQARQRLVR